ncbi:TonB-dependent receptor [Croceibacterium sp. TMG7-5b_MA50]|uniref:TonB-dependent receptor n=1 Tax=Croceibacterium sp. TMG7-5b_MA50 TaxID=3121290 RepID=UPI003221EBB6
MVTRTLGYALGTTAMIVAAALPAEGAQAAAATIAFDIPAQPVNAALARFADQSGLQILYPHDRVAGLRSAAVRGRMPAHQALGRMLAGTGLVIRRTNSGVISLALPEMPATRIPVAITASRGTNALMQVTGGVGATTASAAAADPAPVEESDPIVVTGNRGQPRSVIDSPTPIDVISGTELQRTGRSGVLSALNTLVPSFNLPTRAGGGTSTVIATGGLRGLNPDQTLILVNGKRRHKTSLINAVSSYYNGSVPADLDMIPTSAVERIEVLRDGAAAQYGSDAIAGVINIILKDDPQGGFVSATAGQNYDHSDGELFQAEGSLGLPLGSDGFVNLSVTARKQLASNRAEPISQSIRLYPLVNGALDPREATIDRLVTYNYGTMPSEAIATGYNAGYDLGSVELYSFGTYTQRVSDLNYTYRPPTNANSLPQVFPNGFRPRVVIAEEDYEFAIGARGELSGWNWDVSSTLGRNRARQNADGTLNATLGPSSPTEFYVGSLISREWVNSLDVTRGYDLGGGNLQVSAGLQHRLERYEVVQGDDASSAAGTYTTPLGRPAPGAQGAAGFTADDAGSASRNNIAAYADLAWDPNADITIGGALRFEHYDDDSGDTLIGKLNGRYALSSALSVRGAVSTGFRAPSLAQQIYASTTGQFRTVGTPPTLTLLQIKTLPVGSPAALALGAEPLTPEKSTNISAGIVLTPLPRLNITIDAYQIAVDDRIAITSTLTGNAVSAILVANGLSPDISAQYYTNAIDTRTRGVDVVATYRHGIGDLADLSWNIGFNYNKTKITGVKANPAELATLGPDYVLFDRVSRSNLTVNLPETKLFIGNTLTLDRFTLSTRVVRFGEFKSYGNVVANDREFGAKWITDAELSAALSDTLTLAVGANNLFNVYPDRNDTLTNVNTGAGFYATSGSYGFTGGYYYGRVTVNF